jgi:NADH-quinone oxidoreductase subunit M
MLGAPAKRTAMTASIINVLLSLCALFQYDPAGAKFQFVSGFNVFRELDLKYLVGADGLSLLMILLTALVTLAAIWTSPRVERLPGPFHACLMFISAGAMGAFASLDLFFFYAFHELALIPTFLLIGIWGTGDRHAAAWKITLYLALGSFVLLIGLIGLYQCAPAGERTFDIRALQALADRGELHSPHANQIYLLLLIGFGILISLFPFHTWAPQAYASAPPPAAMLHAGVLKKFGLYGLLRVALPLLPEAAKHWTNLLLLLLVGNILYVGLVTIAQKRLDLMLGYSSVMHMGYIFLGLATLNSIGLSGAALLMFAHGLSIAALFAISGQIRERTGTLYFADLGGLAGTAPFLSLAFGFAAFASIGLPGFANFASEIMIFFGAFKGQTFLTFNFRAATVVALWGVVISAVYMLRAYRSVFLGEMDRRWNDVVDLARPLRWPLVMLLAGLLVAGFYPQFFLNLIAPAVNAFLLVK